MKRVLPYLKFPLSVLFTSDNWTPHYTVLVARRISLCTRDQ
jgi:hypothetical protein